MSATCCFLVILAVFLAYAFIEIESWDNGGGYHGNNHDYDHDYHDDDVHGYGVVFLDHDDGDGHDYDHGDHGYGNNKQAIGHGGHGHNSHTHKGHNKNGYGSNHDNGHGSQGYGSNHDNGHNSHGYGNNNDNGHGSQGYGNNHHNDHISHGYGNNHDTGHGSHGYATNNHDNHGYNNNDHGHDHDGHGYDNDYDYSDIYGGIKGLAPSNVTIYCLLRGGSCGLPGSCGATAGIGIYGATRPARFKGKLMLCNRTTICCLPNHNHPYNDGYGYRIVGYGHLGKPYEPKKRQSKGRKTNRQYSSWKK